MSAVLVTLLFPGAAFFIVFVLLLCGGEDDVSPGWRGLDRDLKIAYLAAVALPLAGLAMYSAFYTLPYVVLSLKDSWRLPALGLLGLLPGLVNLVLVFARRQRRSKLRHILLTLSLLPSLALVYVAGLGWLLELASLFGWRWGFD